MTFGESQGTLWTNYLGVQKSVVRATLISQTTGGRLKRSIDSLNYVAIATQANNRNNESYYNSQQRYEQVALCPLRS